MHKKGWGSKDLPSFFLLLMLAEIPLGIVAMEIVFGERWIAVALTVDTVFGVDAFFARNLLWHDAIGAIGELLDAP